MDTVAMATIAQADSSSVAESGGMAVIGVDETDRGGHVSAIHYCIAPTHDHVASNESAKPEKTFQVNIGGGEDACNKVACRVQELSQQDRDVTSDNSHVITANGTLSEASANTGAWGKTVTAKQEVVIDKHQVPEVVRHRKHQHLEQPMERYASGCRMYVVQPVRFMNSPASPGQAYVPTKFEHIANMVTHGLIIAPAMMGLYWMMSLTTTQMQYWSALVYGIATLALFVTSTAFHTLCYHNERAGYLKKLFHYGDRAIIYIFIAASYTPWLILKDYHGWATFTLWTVWIMAAAGIFYQYRFHERYKLLDTFFYLIIGVCPSVVIAAMKETTGLYECALGGIVYVIGVIFFKCDGRIPFAHAIWHCFVFVGAVFHYIAVCKHLLGNKAYGVDMAFES